MRKAFLFAVIIFAALPAHAGVKDPYKVLGVDRKASAADIKRAYKKLAVEWHPDKNPSKKAKNKFLEIQEAYEILNVEDKRRQYDFSGGASKQQQQHHPHQDRSYAQSTHFHFQRPWGGWASDPITSSTPILNRYQFRDRVLHGSSAWLIQVYMDSSMACRFAMPQWDKAAKDLRDIATLGRVQFAADPVLTAQIAAAGSFLGLLMPVGLQDLPLIVGFPPKCGEFACGVKYSGPVQADLLGQFVADSLLRLPQVPAVTARNVDAFVAAAPAHHVVMLAFSAAPQASLSLRKAAADHSNRITTGRVWVDNKQDLDFWEDKYGVRQLPTVVFLLGPGAAPAVYDASSGARLNIGQVAAKHQWPLVPQLRSSNAHSLGCGWGSGIDHAAQLQACAVLVGRRGQQQQEGRLLLARLAAFLQSKKAASTATASAAFKSSNLRLLWLDAGQQPAFCRYHLGSLGEAAATAVCGRQPWWWWSCLRFWEPRAQRLMVFKPGASKLSLWWNLPHRYSIFQERADAWTPEALAVWLARFLEGSPADVQQQEELPPELDTETTWPALAHLVPQVMQLWRSGLASDFGWSWSLLWLCWRALCHGWAFPVLLALSVILTLRRSRLRGLAIFLTAVAYLVSNVQEVQ